MSSRPHKGSQASIRDLLKASIKNSKRARLNWADGDIDIVNEMLGQDVPKEDVVKRFPRMDPAAFEFLLGAQWKSRDVLAFRMKEGLATAVPPKEAPQAASQNAVDTISLGQDSDRSSFLQLASTQTESRDVMMAGAKTEMRNSPSSNYALLGAKTHEPHAGVGDLMVMSTSLTRNSLQTSSQRQLPVEDPFRMSFRIDAESESSQLELSDIEDEEAMELDRRHSHNLIEIRELERAKLKLDRRLMLKADELKKKRLRDEIKMLEHATNSGLEE